MRWIADRQINIGAQNVDSGWQCVCRGRRNYASTGGNGTIKGKTILDTRGYRDGERIRPDGRGRWFLDLGRKYKTSSAGTNGASSIHMNGNMYVADDLELAGRGSSVTLQGNYYGYNFQKKLWRTGSGFCKKGGV